MPPPRLLVFLKAARLGAVKTRLAATVGAVAALAAYRELVAATLQNLTLAAAELHVELRFSPDDAAREIAPWRRVGWGAVAQGAGDLGERLARGFGDALGDGCQRVLVIGSDCPTVNAADLRAALVALEDHDVVLGPATDGGYWLLGLRAPQPELFTGIDWSTPQVLAQTLQRAAAAGLRVARLRELSDVDTEVEWRKWANRRR